MQLAVVLQSSVQCAGGIGPHHRRHAENEAHCYMLFKCCVGRGSGQEGRESKAQYASCVEKWWRIGAAVMHSASP